MTMVLFGPSFDQAGANFYIPRPGGCQFNIASEASYVYILSGKKFIKNAKNDSFLESFWKPETVLPDRLL